MSADDVCMEAIIRLLARVGEITVKQNGNRTYTVVAGGQSFVSTTVTVGLAMAMRANPAKGGP